MPDQSNIVSSADLQVYRARATAMRAIEAAEERFVRCVTRRGALTPYQAELAIRDQRPAVMEALDDALDELRSTITSSAGAPGEGEILVE